MDIHKPKPVHTWRELLSEVGVIVIGIAIALTGEQAIEALHWRHRVEAAETSMRGELGLDLAYAAESQAFAPCLKGYVDRLEAAILANRPDIEKQLFAAQEPYDLNPWRVTAWEAAVSAQVADHLDHRRLDAYAAAFRRVLTERELQFQINDHFSEAMTGRFGLPKDARVMSDQLTGAEKFRSDSVLAQAVSSGLLHDGETLGVEPDREIVKHTRALAAKCMTDLAALPAA